MTVKRAVILGAGQGARMRPLTEDKPKILLSVGGQSVVRRLITQLIDLGIEEIVIVAGFEKNKVFKELADIKSPGLKLEIVENDDFAEDVNILSTHKAMQFSDDPFILFDGDILFEDSAVDTIVQSANTGRSFWYTVGPFNASQYGGILKADANGKIQDIKIVPAFEQQFAGYKKLLGVMTIGPEQVERYKALIEQYVSQSIKQYYLAPWIDHLSELECFECDLAPTRSCSFNSPEDFERACKLILED